MKSSIKTWTLICASLLFLSSQCESQKDLLIESDFGYVNFNLTEAPKLNAGRQELSLYGCNTVVTTRDVVWNGANDLEWGVNNQVLSGVPFGYQNKDGREYFVSKYYMASPPVMGLMYGSESSQNQPVIIGLVIPDQFTFMGERPVQIVHLDYNILEPVYLNYVDVDYFYRVDESTMSCGDLGVDLIPLNIQCKDFAWQNKPSTEKIFDAKGASGIGRLRNEEGQRQVFLPSYDADGEDCLDCTITILDDILLKHEVFFATEDGYAKTISLTDFYKKYGNEESIKLACRPRFELPEGCRPTE